MQTSTKWRYKFGIEELNLKRHQPPSMSQIQYAAFWGKKVVNAFIQKAISPGQNKLIYQ